MPLLRRDRDDQKLKWLAEQPWWRDLPREDLHALAATGDRITVPADRDLMSEGERGRETAVIVTGEVEVVHDGEVLARLGPGEVVGELSLLDRVPRNADVRTASEVELLVFSLHGLQRAMAASASVRRDILEAAEDHRG